MVGIVGKLSSKNQITVPAEIRETLGVKAHDKLEFLVNEQGAVEIRRPKYTLLSLAGSIPALPGASASLRQEIVEATEIEMARKFPNERRA